MTAWKEYYLAESIHDALEALAHASAPARLVAGGTDLLLELQQGVHAPVHTLVDITRIPELNRLEETGSGVFIGAALPINQVAGSPLVQAHAEALVDACRLIGGPQVRNSGTLGGNVAHALPAADGMIALVALDAQVEIASGTGNRLQPILSLFHGPGKSALNPTQEILVGFHLSCRKPNQGSAFQRIMRPQGVALPILNLAIWLEQTEDKISEIRIAFGPSGPVPIRAKSVEDYLRGKSVDSRHIEAASQLIQEGIHFRTSAHRATAEYRYEVSAVLLEETISAAWQRAGGISK